MGYSGSSRLKIFLTLKSAGKGIASNESKTITGNSYVTLLTTVREDSESCLQDIAPAYKNCMLSCKHLRFKLFKHPPYPMHLVPSDIMSFLN